MINCFNRLMIEISLIKDFNYKNILDSTIMTLFETTIPIKHEEISQIVQENWKIKLGKVIKESQNHTFQAFSFDDTQHYAVRVTPDPQKKHFQRISDELFFVNYLALEKLNHICAIVPPIQNEKQKGNLFIVKGDLIIVVFQWAKGQLLPFPSFQWMSNKKVVQAWGRFFAQLHAISRKFGKQHQQVAKRIQSWRQIHHSILADTELHPDDQKLVDNPEHYGVIHGDLNCSNFFYVRETDNLSVFDTDQTQRGFYLWDMSQAVFTSVMLKQAGFPISGQPVPQANPKQFEDSLVKGYQSIAGQGWVDRARLARMINHKKQFYKKFCYRAAEEGNIPGNMAPFINYIVEWFKKKEETQ